MKPKRILFIGNSHTHVNNVPALLEELANDAGRSVKTGMVTRGGESLMWHWYNPETRDAITSGKWDLVVLQELSSYPVDEPEKMRAAATRLVTIIRQAGAEPILYMTWARQHIPEMQDGVTSTYRALGQALTARVAPVGSAWRKAMDASPELSLHTEDRNHANLLGSYLAACVIYATIFAESPEGLSNELHLLDRVTSVIDKDVALLLQRVAWETAKEADPKDIEAR